MKILHFADAHIDMANYGRVDPETNLPVRVVDFLVALDQIVNRTIEEQVDLVIFAGDAYKDRNPQPTFQREWERRIMRLSQAHIPTILLVGNHDIGRSSNRAHTLEEFRTLQVPHIHVADRIELFTPEVLGIEAQVLALPWISPSGLMTREEAAGKPIHELFLHIHELVANKVNQLIEAADPAVPLILTAHTTIEGAAYGSERQVMLGHEVVLSPGLVRHPQLDYVALGHIHKHQNLNPGHHPPVIYSGSIERIDFGEIKEDKGFVLAQVEKGRTSWEFIKLRTRPFLDYRPETLAADTFMEDILHQLPDPAEVEGAICRVQLSYPRDWETLVDEVRIAKIFDKALSFQLLKQRIATKRARLGDTVAVEELSPLELLDKYWETQNVDVDEAQILQSLAKEILGDLA
jgi:exonuclease SbcD